MAENKINIIVNGQNIEIKKNETIVKGTKGYLKCGILFSDEWNGLNKVLVCSNTFEFKQEKAAPIIGNTCNIPDEVTDKRRIFIKVIGKDNQKIIVTKVGVLEQEV